MLRSYLIIAIRHLGRQKLYSAINIIGLAIGLASCVLIALFIRFELSYDKQFINSDRIYRISRDFFPADGNPYELYLATIAPQAAPLLKLDFPQIEQVARINCCVSVQISREDDTLFDEGVALVDNELFEIFDFEWLQGDSTDALLEPFTIVLTESMARKYFGAEDPMGQTLLVESEYSAKVTGVIRNLPENTHLAFSGLLSLSTAEAVYGEEFLNNWGSNGFHTYALLRDGADIAEIQSQSGEFFERHMNEGASRSTGFTAVALTDIHLRSTRDNEMGTPGSITSLYTMSAIAAFILLIACINFMNLSTARSARRAKEVGIRTAVGANRSQLVSQFLGESILLTLIAVIFAMALVELTLPILSAYVQRQLVLDYGEFWMLPTLGALTLSVGLLAGSYPAFFLSAFNPARVLKGDVTRGKAAASFRKALVVLQFSISIALIIGTGVVYSQMRFARNIELGYNKDQVVILSSASTAGLGAQWQALKQQLLAHPEITKVTASNLISTQRNTSASGIIVEGGSGIAMSNLRVDFGFFETYEIEVLAGRVFSEDYGSDRSGSPTEETPWASGSFVLNELAVRQLGWEPEEVIGKPIRMPTARGTGVRGTVIGVVNSPYFESVHIERQPMFFRVPPDRIIDRFDTLRHASIRITGTNITETLEHIDAKWSEFVPEQPISRRFLDDAFQALYVREERQAQILGFFSLLAIFIACLGLFGLASFTTENRSKEIGIRKAFGGSVWDIARLFSTETSKLVLMSNLLAWPAAYFLMQRWLQSFAYRIDMSPLIYIGGALIALVIAWLTVGGVAARAANANPIVALRYE